ncbi:NAD-dependent epimerase/dehydratase family protein [Fictibacillus sp. b24]|uniref:NAD-dependent epimerase/dehydratase family protein n=1 Tax=Fictibacillus sp. b24 TaxID=3055863 RepID=UPI0025A30A68|nr:NAD-dependent epimerase/dehydratase family protein [Fictibacillus sp. b24]MDM5316753.1 NAD-dependent epimerase/dehydratase family protein [Fictibacillus sp. b24]
MSVVVITGSAGLIGSEASEYYLSKGYTVIGIDNNMRKFFFGDEADTSWNRTYLEQKYPKNYIHHEVDIRNTQEVFQIFKRYQNEIVLIIHTAAQPSHDWASTDPITDFNINANGTLNLLEAFRLYSPKAVFIFTSTNKVYGDYPNQLPLKELEKRWEIDPLHPYFNGIQENMNVDQCLHSLFGVSKLSADVLVQEYGKYFKLHTYCLRGGVLSGSKQSGVAAHGFINYLMKCVMLDIPYIIYGHKGKQVRDVIHSKDVISAMDCIFRNPQKCGEVYNLGGGRHSNVSILEAIDIAQEISGQKLKYQYSPKARIGDHIWYVSSLNKFKTDYPDWDIKFDIQKIMKQIYKENKTKWKKTT